MSTDKHRIAAYIPSEVKEKFEAFKLERKVGDSKALVIILTEFLGVSYQVAHPPDLLNELKIELLSELKKEVAIIEQKLGELRSELPKPGKEVFLSSTATEGILNIGEKSDKLENSVKVNTPIKIGGELMAKRMGYANSKSLANLKKDEEFSAKTMLRDPDGIAWVYCKKEGNKRIVYIYSPESELEGELKSKLLSWIKENAEQN
jgi:hypothetical protein